MSIVCSNGQELSFETSTLNSKIKEQTRHLDEQNETYVKGSPNTSKSLHMNSFYGLSDVPSYYWPLIPPAHRWPSKELPSVSKNQDIFKHNIYYPLSYHHHSGDMPHFPIQYLSNHVQPTTSYNSFHNNPPFKNKNSLPYNITDVKMPILNKNKHRHHPESPTFQIVKKNIKLDSSDYIEKLEESYNFNDPAEENSTNTFLGMIMPMMHQRDREFSRNDSLKPKLEAKNADNLEYEEGEDKEGATAAQVQPRRKNATRETTSALKAWLIDHRKNPYPTKGEKIMLAIITKMTLTQVSTWFANARRRLKKESKAVLVFCDNGKIINDSTPNSGNSSPFKSLLDENEGELDQDDASSDQNREEDNYNQEDIWQQYKDLALKYSNSFQSITTTTITQKYDSSNTKTDNQSSPITVHCDISSDINRRQIFDEKVSKNIDKWNPKIINESQFLRDTSMLQRPFFPMRHLMPPTSLSYCYYPPFYPPYYFPCYDGFALPLNAKDSFTQATILDKSNVDLTSSFPHILHKHHSFYKEQTKYTSKENDTHSLNDYKNNMNEQIIKPNASFGELTFQNEINDKDTISKNITTYANSSNKRTPKRSFDDHNSNSENCTKKLKGDTNLPHKIMPLFQNSENSKSDSSIELNNSFLDNSKGEKNFKNENINILSTKKNKIWSMAEIIESDDKS